jgi:FKBP-type peptidyl-prolyl cis-trans isomerase SlyD
MKISRNTVATVAFTVTDESGKVVGRTQPDEPVTALIGYHFLVPGLEKALDGHEAGDSFTVTLTPKDSYGEYDKTMVQEIDRRMFGDFPIEVGNVFEADSNNGPVAVVVKEIKENTVVVDGNHPLAGKTLTFLVEVKEVREATDEEKKHGHAHPNGKCPSEDGDHDHCCCGHHHHHDGEGCCGHHHHDGGDGECCHHHDGDDDGCCGHHHDGGDHECCCHKEKEQ